MVPSGISDKKVIENWVRPVFEPDLLSTNLLRWELCNEAIGLVSTLQLSSEHIDKADVLMRVYKHLIEKRNTLIRIITPKPKSAAKSTEHADLDAPTAAAESPFRNRDDAFEKIRSFMNQNLNVAFVLSGMKGMGKSSVIEAAFRQVIPPTRRIRLQITEGMPYARLLLELAHKFGVRVPGESSFDVSGEQLEAIQKRLLAHVSHSQPTVIVHDDFQYLLGNTREIDDPAGRNLIRELLNTASNTKTKCFIVSNISPSLGPDLAARGKSREVEARH